MPAGEAFDLGRVVAGEQAGPLAPGQPLVQQGLHPSGAGRVQGGGGFIQQEDVRIKLQRPEQSQQLQLTAREPLRRQLEEAGLPAQLVQPAENPRFVVGLVSRSLATMAAIAQHLPQVLLHRASEGDRPLLHVSDPGAIHRQGPGAWGAPTQQDLAPLQRIKPGQLAQQQGLAGPTGPHQGQSIPRVQRKAQALPERAPLEMPCQILVLQQGSGWLDGGRVGGTQASHGINMVMAGEASAQTAITKRWAARQSS